MHIISFNSYPYFIYKGDVETEACWGEITCILLRSGSSRARTETWVYWTPRSIPSQFKSLRQEVFLPTCAVTWVYIFIFLFFRIYFIFLAALGLRCCTRAFSSCDERGLLFVVLCVLLIAVASLAVEHGLQARGLQQLCRVDSVVVACELQSAGSVVVVHRLSCSTACGIFPDQGSNPCPLHWQADS